MFSNSTRYALWVLVAPAESSPGGYRLKFLAEMEETTIADLS